ncbi:SMI1/KNR4 family protein [Pseudomonas sp. Z1-14]|uniref:SMI1/KNR4 family protein n=1 Tax=Pseudomonas sp. Z1-14 TaxID=2817409 RepID=UPI003DA7C067
MNIQSIEGLVVANNAISNAQLAELQRELGMQLPDVYVQMLNLANGFSLESGVVMYSSDELVERNETFEVKKYAPGYLAVGDDSGGRSILLSLVNKGVYLVDQGSMDPDDFELINILLNDWINNGCVL